MGQYLTDWPEERIAKYRRMAADARESAYNARTIEICNAYMDLATAWETMAVDLEHAEEAKQHVRGRSSAQPILDRTIP